MHREFLMGNEAIAMGAIAAGVNLAAGYPGTPSSEVLETIAKHRPEGVYVEWSVNEKSAMEVAAGAAYSGARAIVTMKQVGLNVASDPLMSLEYVGVKGGLVVLVADDPGPISSQTEQDTRHFAAFSKLPCLDPSSAQEAYEMVQDAFELSERYQTPVFLRPTTRVCHGYASITVKDPSEYSVNTPESFVRDTKRWVIFPKLARMNHEIIEQRNQQLKTVFSEYEKNRILGTASADKQGNQSDIPGRLGVASGGISYTYCLEAYKALGPFPLLKVSTPFPFPEPLALKFLQGLDEVLCVEELDPVIEENLIQTAGKYHLPVIIRGKLTGELPSAGENSRDITSDAIRRFLKDRKPLCDTGAGCCSAETLNSGENCSPAEIPGTGKACNSMESLNSGDPGKICSPAESAQPSAPAASAAGMPELPVRPPVLCAGCPHRASFYAVKQAMKGKKSIFCGDIGCYTLGNAMPLDMVDTCLCMGAGLGIAQGVGHMDPEMNCFAFVGDSTFFASAITGVVNAVYNQADMTLVILDNSTTAMTGHQPHPGTGRTMMGEIVAKIDMEAVLRGIGVETVETVNPLELERAIACVRETAAKPGVKAIIFRYPCIALVKKHAPAVTIDREQCIGCGRCVREIGCPALYLKERDDQGTANARIAVTDPSLCTGCGLCRQLCPTGAIKGGGQHEA